MRRRIIIGNWKMNPVSTQEMLTLACSIEGLVASDQSEVVICPPFIGLQSIINSVACQKVKIGAQNAWSGDTGAFTGEISMAMLKNLGCEYVILGHSERRQYQNESSELINQKIKSALEYGLTPVLCVGEFNKVTGGKRQVTGGDDVSDGISLKVARNDSFKAEKKQIDQNDEYQNIFLQLEHSLANLSVEDINKIIIAYEPVWAIGTGDAATGEYASQMIGRLRNSLDKINGTPVGSEIHILYGGSVNASNAADYAKEAEIDGALVGGASLDPDEFGKIIKAFAN